MPAQSSNQAAASAAATAIFKRLPAFSWLLFGLSVLMLVATAILLDLHGKATYFALFHKPLQFSNSARSSDYKAPALPAFTVHPSISSSSLFAGGLQTISLTASSDTTVRAYVEVWIEGPHGKQVFRSPSTQPFSFMAGTSYAFSYHYVVPAGLPAGQYNASAIMQSVDTNTDYYVNENFAGFSVK